MDHNQVEFQPGQAIQQAETVRSARNPDEQRFRSGQMAVLKRDFKQFIESHGFDYNARPIIFWNVFASLQFG